MNEKSSVAKDKGPRSKHYPRNARRLGGTGSHTLPRIEQDLALNPSLFPLKFVAQPGDRPGILEIETLAALCCGSLGLAEGDRHRTEGRSELSLRRLDIPRTVKRWKSETMRFLYSTRVLKTRGAML